MKKLKANYTIAKRRKRKNLTNYKKRLELLKSRKPRLVIRRSLNHIILQLVFYNDDGDQTKLLIRSDKLKKFGWNYSFKNLPACYLTGLYFGKEMLKNNFKEAILDMGYFPSVKGSRIYAALKGVIDAGIDVPHSDDVFPNEERLTGKHINDSIVNDFEKVKEKILSN